MGDGTTDDKVEKPGEKPAAAASAKPAADDATLTELAQLRKEKLERQKADADADTARKTKLKEDGDLKKLLEEQAKDLEKANSKLAELGEDAKLGKSARAQYAQAITDAKAKLSPAQKDLVETLEKVDIAKAAALVAQFTGTSSTTTPTPNPGNPGGPPGTTEAIDFAAAWGDDKKWTAAKERDPDGAAKWLSEAISGGPKKQTPLQFLPRKAPTPAKK